MLICVPRRVEKSSKLEGFVYRLTDERILERRAMEPDVDWLDYLNLRNLIAHGLVPAVGGGGAALLLHAACFLSVLRPDTEQ